MKQLFSIVLITLCTACASSSGIKDHKIPHWDKLGERSTADLNMIVIHATEMPDLDESREYHESIMIETSGTGASGHYYVDRNGDIEQYVPDSRIANHTLGWSKKTLSIELVNIGRYPNWYHSDHQVMQEEYPKAQIDALITLLNDLITKYPTIKFTQGHEDLDTRKIPAENDATILVDRKMDPGEHFPWAVVLARTPLVKQTPEKEQ